MTLKHSFVSPVTDGGDSSLVGPDEWNANHSIVTDLSPDVDDGASLGTTSKQWSDANFAAGAIIQWAGGNQRLEHNNFLGWTWVTTTGNTQFVLEAGLTQAPRIQVKWAGDSFARINFGIASGGVPNFQFGPGNADRDTSMTRAAPATWQLGLSDDTAAIAQTLQVQSVVAGTSNTAGAAWTLKDSAGTGTGASGGYDFKVHPAGTSGTSQNAAATAFKINSDKTVQLAGFTVATLPTAGTAGRRAYVTDATAPTYNGALTGGGAVVVPVFDNGSAWVSA